ncbi:MAG TPA: NifU family protein [Candidatus Paceibacterota bacterium]
MESEIKKVLSEQVSPMLAFHRGDAEFVGYSEGVVTLRLTGTCKGCPLAALTLKEGIETILKENLHGIERVEAVE